MTTRKKKSRAFRTIRLTKRGGGVGPSTCMGKLCPDYDEELRKQFKLLITAGTINIETVRDLLVNGANSNGIIAIKEPKDGVMVKNVTTLLNIAISYGKIEIAKLLMEYGADPNYGDDLNGDMAINIAIRMGRIEIVDMLLKDGTTHLDNENNDGQTPLDVAVDVAKQSKRLLEENPTGNYEQQFKISTKIVIMLWNKLNMLRNKPIHDMISPTIKTHVENQQINIKNHVENQQSEANVLNVANSRNLPPDIEKLIYGYLRHDVRDDVPRGGKSKSKRRRTRRNIRNKKGTRRK